METPATPPKTSIEAERTYRIEHFPSPEDPKIDVIVNLDYPYLKYRTILLSKLSGSSKEVPDLLEEIERLKLDKSQVFYVKDKSEETQAHVDFIRGRTEYDPLTPDFADDFDKQSRYGLAGVLNEIILSKKIKEIVNSGEVQDMVKKYHELAGILFSEPIVALIDKKTNRKYLIYKYEDNSGYPVFGIRIKIADALRRIFLKHGINPHDLRAEQFMVTEKDKKPYVVLIDTEAYTEVDNKAKIK